MGEFPVAAEQELKVHDSWKAEATVACREVVNLAWSRDLALGAFQKAAVKKAGAR